MEPMISKNELVALELQDADIHTDALTGFKAKSEVFYFGKRGADYAEVPFMTLIPGEKETSLRIGATDFCLFDWSITLITKEVFDENGEYNFSYQQWKRVLEEANRLLSFQTFDELFAYMTEAEVNTRWGDNYLLNALNCHGVHFWKDRVKYACQLRDMREWTELVLSEGDTMKIYGF